MNFKAWLAAERIYLDSFSQFLEALINTLVCLINLSEDVRRRGLFRSTNVLRRFLEVSS